MEKSEKKTILKSFNVYIVGGLTPEQGIDQITLDANEFADKAGGSIRSFQILQVESNSDYSMIILLTVLIEKD